MKTSTETVSAFTAKTNLSGLLKEVQKDNLYIVTLRGKPIAKIIPYNDDIKEDSIEVALQNLNTIRQKTKGNVDIRSMINAGLGSLDEKLIQSAKKEKVKIFK